MTFHDDELLDGRRAAVVWATLVLLAGRRVPVGLGAVGAEVEVEWADVCVV